MVTDHSESDEKWLGKQHRPLIDRMPVKYKEMTLPVMPKGFREWLEKKYPQANTRELSWHYIVQFHEWAIKEYMQTAMYRRLNKKV